jgi:hypothetical protein
MTGCFDGSAQRGSPGVESKPKEGHAFNVNRQAILGGSAPEEATSWTLPHLSGKSLEGTLSSVPRKTKARVSHPTMGPGAFHPGSYNHHKNRSSR